MRLLPIAVTVAIVAASATFLAAPAEAIPTAAISPAGWDFGSQPSPNFTTTGNPTAGPPHTFTITNNSASAITAAATLSGDPEFDITADTCAGGVAGNGSCTVTVVGIPDAVGDFTGSLNVNINSNTLILSANLAVQGVESVSGIYADPHAASVDFIWNRLPQEIPAQITSFDVLRGTTSGSLSSIVTGLPAGTTHYLDTTTTPNTTYFYALIPHNSGGPLPQVPTTPVNAIPWTHGGAGAYYPLSKPTRFLDTRTGQGAPAVGRLAPGKTLSLQITGRGGVPSSGVAAVVVNLIIVSPIGTTSLTAYPSGHARPAGQAVWGSGTSSIGNTVTIRLGTGGKININNSSSHSTHVVADVEGYYSTSTSLVATKGDGGNYLVYDNTPVRWIDTRQSFGLLTPNTYLDFPVYFSTRAQNHVKAVAVSITASGATGAGSFVAYNDYTQNFPTLPKASSLNFSKGVTTQNLAIVPVTYHLDPFSGEDQPFIAVGNGSGASANLIVDIVGFYDDDYLSFGERFDTFTNQTRLANSALHTGGLTHDLGPNETQTIDPGANGVNLTAHFAMNVIAVAPTATTTVSVWPDVPIDPLPKPDAGLIRAAKARNTASSVLPETGVSNVMDIYNQFGTTSVRVDATGRFDFLPFADHMFDDSALAVSTKQARVDAQRAFGNRTARYGSAQGTRTPVVRQRAAAF